MFGSIKTQPQLQEAILSTYLYDAIIAVVFILLLVLIISLIPWQGGKVDNSGKKRRMWFYILLVATLFTTAIFNYFGFMSNIMVGAFKSDYMLTLILGSLMASAIYFIVLFAIIKTRKNKTKLSSIFPKKM
ncbi:MAG: hypothetical protein R3Y59_03985 [bacterium]